MKSTQIAFVTLGFILFALTACLPPITEEHTFEKNIQDPVSQKIWNYADQFKSDSLLPYLSHANPSYRYLAARGFANSRDARHLDTLITLLSDPHPKVRTMAAFAMGQLGDPAAERPLVEAFIPSDSLNQWDEFNATVLEAIGKCGSPNNLKYIATVRTYLPSDTALLEGQCRAIYRYALRDMVSSEGTQKMLEYVKSSLIPNTARLIAAHYLARAKNIQLDTVAEDLSKVFRTEKDPHIRMALALSLGKTKDPIIITALQKQFTADRDYRVRVNIIRALADFNYWQVKPIIRDAFEDENIHVKNALASYLQNHGSPKEAYWYLLNARKDTSHWTVQTGLYRATLKTLPLFYYNSKRRISNELKTWYQSSNNNYEKAAILEALAEFFPNYAYIREQGYSSITPVIRSSAVRSLGYIAMHPDLKLFYRNQYEAVRKDLSNHLIDAIKSGDVGMISEASSAFVRDTTGLIDLIENDFVLTNVFDQLELQQDQEAWLNLSRAIAKTKGKAPEEVELPVFTGHPIDWKQLQKVNDTSMVSIQTNRGKMTIELYPFVAPGTCANLLSLMQKGFYEGKYIHRVVPNFVIQGGCSRGDGYGSPEYAIRSEFSTVYYDKAGYIGMASIGNHTEGTQWFITHSPTPHLDGNYTLFGRVTEGMEFLHDVQIGDRIEQISLPQ